MIVVAATDHTDGNAWLLLSCHVCACVRVCACVLACALVLHPIGCVVDGVSLRHR